MNRSSIAMGYSQYAKVQGQTFDSLWHEIMGLNPATILDLGCGNGHFTQRLPNHFPLAEVVALDVNEAMISHAKLHHAHHRITYQVGDIITHPIPETDVILANASLHWMTPFDVYLSRIQSILSKNGVLVASVFGPDTYWELAATLGNVMGRPIVLAATQFLTPLDLQRTCLQVFDRAKIWQVRYREWFPSVLGLLHSIKQTGTRGNGIPGTIWTQGLIDEVDRVYRLRFRAIWATYQVTMIHASH